MPYVAVNQEGKYYIIDRLVSTGRTSTEKTKRGYKWIANPKMGQDKTTADGKSVKVPFIVDAMSSTMSEAIYKALGLEMPAGGRSGIDAVSLAQDLVLQVDPTMARVAEGDQPLPSTITLPFGLSMERLREVFIHLGGLASAEKKEKNKRKIKLLRDFATQTEETEELEEDKAEAPGTPAPAPEPKPEEKVMPTPPSVEESDEESEVENSQEQNQDQEMSETEVKAETEAPATPEPKAEEHEPEHVQAQSEESVVSEEQDQEMVLVNLPRSSLIREDDQASDVLTAMKVQPEQVMPKINSRALEVLRNAKSTFTRPILPSAPVVDAMSVDPVNSLYFAANDEEESPLY